MKLGAFEYLAPRSLSEALEMRAKLSYDSAVLAGGQSLVPLLALRLANPTAVIDLRLVPGLTGIKQTDGFLSVGAMTRQREVERSRAADHESRLLAAAVGHIGHIAIRNRGTVGGSVCHADGAAELPAVCVALDAELVAASVRGRRTIEAEDFFQGFLTTALEPDELLVEVRFPVGAGRAGSSFVEVARRHGDFALVGVVAVVRLDHAGLIEDSRISLLGMAGAPMRALEAERRLQGIPPDAEAFEYASRLSVDGIEPPDDIHASGQYRQRVAVALVQQALNEAARVARA